MSICLKKNCIFATRSVRNRLFCSPNTILHAQVYPDFFMRWSIEHKSLSKVHRKCRCKSLCNTETEKQKNWRISTMNYLPHLRIVIGCLAMIMLSLIIHILLKHRRAISRWWRKRAIGKLIVNVILPFVISLIMSVVTTLFSSDDNRCSCADCKSIFTKHRPILLVTWGLFAFALINVVFQIIAWVREHKEEDIRWENAATRYAYNNMFRIFMDKNTRLRGAYHHGLKQGMLADADIPYNVFSQIRTICWELCDTIGQITQIEKKDLSAAFIYHYCYEGATESDRQYCFIMTKKRQKQITNICFHTAITVIIA